MYVYGLFYNLQIEIDISYASYTVRSMSNLFATRCLRSIHYVSDSVDSGQNAKIRRLIIVEPLPGASFIRSFYIRRCSVY